MTTLLLLFCSNVFMTFAWYGHLKYGHDWPIWKAILVSWVIALLEYCLAVPANRIGYGEFSGFQLKIMQEVVTLVVFIGFAITFLNEKLAWNYLVAFAFLGMAAFFAFAFKTPGIGSPNDQPGNRRHKLIEPKLYIAKYGKDLPETGNRGPNRSEGQNGKMSVEQMRVN